MKDKHIGSSFDNFLEEEGIKEEVTIEAYKKVVEQLKADRLELAKAIKADHTEGFFGDDCIFCYCGGDRHDKDCIVLKAEKIIEEMEK